MLAAIKILNKTVFTNYNQTKYKKSYIFICVPTIDFVSQTGYNKLLKEDNYEKEEYITFNKVPCRKK